MTGSIPRNSANRWKWGPRVAFAVAGAVAPTAPSVPMRSRQTVVIDEASFTVARRGDVVRREAFSIQRVPGTGYVATATVIFADRRESTALTTDTGGVPLRYQRDVRSSAGHKALLSGRAERGYFSIQSQMPRGEEARELLLPPHARLLDDGVVNLWYFVSRGVPIPDETMPVIRPDSNAPLTLEIQSAMPDSVWVDGHLLHGTHRHLTGSDSITRDVWTDPEGRLLAVAQDSAGVATIARRDEIPR